VQVINTKNVLDEDIHNQIFKNSDIVINITLFIKVAKKLTQLQKLVRLY